MSGLIDPADGAFVITPSDLEDLNVYARGIYISTAGDVAVDMANGDTVTFSNLAVGVVHSLRIRKVYSTGTTISGVIVGLK